MGENSNYAILKKDLFYSYMFKEKIGGVPEKKGS